jgi:hypothetical protein
LPALGAALDSATEASLSVPAPLGLSTGALSAGATLAGGLEVAARLAERALRAFAGAFLVVFFAAFFAAFLVERAAAFFVPFLPALPDFREAAFLVERAAAFLPDFLAAFLDFPARDFFPAAFLVAFLVAMRVSFVDYVLLRAWLSNIGLYSLK